jgi:hypothetical protein
MPPTFTGVDPYVESQGYWRDFHHRFLTYCSDAIAEALPANYEARMDEDMKLINRGVEEVTLRKTIPDVGILRKDSVETGAGDTAVVATLEPVTVELPVVEEVREAWIEIYRHPGRELVTVIDVLSPTNKEEPDRELYLVKRNSLLVQHVHLVEIDLLLKGKRLPMRQKLPSGDYYALVSRQERHPLSDVYAWQRDRRLPGILIPLKAPDADIPLDLAAVYKIAHQRGRYTTSIDYNKPLSA